MNSKEKIHKVMDILYAIQGYLPSSRSSRSTNASAGYAGFSLAG
jgi:hypothetical protein